MADSHRIAVVATALDDNGHWRHYVNHMLAFAETEKTLDQFVFLLDPVVAGQLNLGRKARLESKGHAIVAVPFARSAGEPLEAGPFRIALDTVGETRRLIQFAREELKADGVVFTALDRYLLGLAAVGDGGMAIGGLLLSPPHRLAEATTSSGVGTRLRALVRVSRKRALLRIAGLRCGNLRIGLLNDRPGCEVVAKMAGRRARGVHVPEPVLVADRVEQSGHDSPGETRVLSIGSISSRKNADGMLAAIEFARSLPGCPNGISARISGPIAANIEKELNDLAEQLKDQDLPVSINDSLLDSSTFAAEIRSSHAVFLAYRDFAGSSNVIAQAAAQSRPVVVAPGGVMAEIVREFDLGVIARSLDHGDLAAAIVDAINFDSGRMRIDEFLRQSTPELFSDAMLDLARNGVQ